MKIVISGREITQKHARIGQNTARIGAKPLQIMFLRASTRSKHCYRNDLRSVARAWRLDATPENAAQRMIELGRASHVLLEHGLREVHAHCIDMGEAPATITRRFATVAAFLRAATRAGEAWAHEIAVPTRRNPIRNTP